MSGRQCYFKLNYKTKKVILQESKLLSALQQGKLLLSLNCKNNGTICIDDIKIPKDSKPKFKRTEGLFLMPNECSAFPVVLNFHPSITARLSEKYNATCALYLTHMWAAFHSKDEARLNRSTHAHTFKLNNILRFVGFFESCGPIIMASC